MSEQQNSAPGNAPVPSPAVIDTMTRVIMSQTDMTEEQVKAALEHTNYDLKRVIREYMRGPESSTAAQVASAATSVAPSTNQIRFAEIRNFMDKSAEQYYRRQEMTKIYNEVLERKKAAAAEAAAIETTATEAAVSKL
jgi:hypothetical protein